MSLGDDVQSLLIGGCFDDYCWGLSMNGEKMFV